MKKNNIYDTPVLKQFINQTGQMFYKDKLGKERSFIANHNSNGFRSDEFIKTHEGRHIVFAGCSETYGRGGDIEESWAHMVYSSISKSTQTSGFFNLGTPGAGFKEILCTVIDYCNSYAKPNDIFILMPNLERYIWYVDTFLDKENNGYYGVCIDDENYGRMTGSNNKTVDLRKSSYSNDKEEFANFIIMMKIFEEFCQSSEINLFWGTWDTDNMFGKELKDNLFNLKFYSDINTNLHKVKEYCDSENMSLFKPDGHAGSAMHAVWADQFVKKYNERIHWGASNA
jgi:hypothetical protein